MSKQKKGASKPGTSENQGSKLFDIILISLAVVFVIIGIYEIMVLGPSNGYWSVMLAMVFFFGYKIRQSKS